MTKKRLIIPSLILLLLAGVSSGCSRLPPRPADLPKLYPTKVTVTFGGKAIEGVNVSLHSPDKNVKWRASGYTDKNGTAELKTSFAFPGAPEGKFIISFDKKSSTPTAENKAEVKSEIPLKYSIEHSKETVEVKPQKNVFPFTLDGGTETITVNEPTNTGRMPKAIQ